MIPRVVLSLMVVAVLGAFALTPNPAQRYDFVTGTTVTLSGTSTMHDYSCTATVVQGSLLGEIDASKKLVGVSETTVTIPVKSLECGKGQMDENLQKALKSKNNPNIVFALKEVAVSGQDQKAQNTLKAKGQLTVAGVQKPIEFTASAVVRTDGFIEIEGSVPLKMSTFGVKAPTMFLGTLKTSDDVNVKFKVVAQQASGV